MTKLRRGIVTGRKVEFTDGPPPPDGMRAIVFWRKPGQALEEYAAMIARTLQADGDLVTLSEILAGDRSVPFSQNHAPADTRRSAQKGTPLWRLRAPCSMLLEPGLVLLPVLDKTSPGVHALS